VHRGETHSQRVSVVIGLSVQLPMDLVQAVMSMAQVFKEQTLAQALSDAAELGEELPAARIFGDASEGPCSRSFRQRRIQSVSSLRTVGSRRGGSDRCWAMATLGSDCADLKPLPVKAGRGGTQSG